MMGECRGPRPTLVEAATSNVYEVKGRRFINSSIWSVVVRVEVVPATN